LSTWSALVDRIKGVVPFEAGDRVLHHPAELGGLDGGNVRFEGILARLNSW
jgi:hypothetical protein